MKSLIVRHKCVILQMKKETHGRKKKKACDDDCESVEVDTKLHCDEDISVMKLELQQVKGCIWFVCVIGCVLGEVCLHS